LTQSENVKLPTTDLLHETQSEKCTLQNGNLLDINSKFVIAITIQCDLS
jgi:hypothetical protein